MATITATTTAHGFFGSFCLPPTPQNPSKVFFPPSLSFAKLSVYLTSYQGEETLCPIFYFTVLHFLNNDNSLFITYLSVITQNGQSRKQTALTVVVVEESCSVFLPTTTATTTTTF